MVHFDPPICTISVPQNGSYCFSLTIPPGSGVKVSDFKALKREVYDKKEKACPFNEEGQAEVFSFSTGYQR
jgi:hypothetical protein